MKVKELIDELKRFPEDMDVAYLTGLYQWDSVYKVELIENGHITSCIVDDDERKKIGTDVKSFVGLSY